MRGYLGVDVGSVSTNLVLLEENGEVAASVYLRTMGQPIRAVQGGLRQLGAQLPPDVEVLGAGTTGSARHLSGIIVGADIVKNEITAHAVAALHVLPEVRTVKYTGDQYIETLIQELKNGPRNTAAMKSPLIADTEKMGWADIALTELISDKLSWETPEITNTAPVYTANLRRKYRV